jgi:hypothetical protein
MAHIFISYSKQNIEFIRYLRALLESEGFAVWVDEARLAPSARWWKTIEENIETCSVFIIVMSSDAEESDWVEREILLAEKLKRPIFPILLNGDPWSRLANIQYEDMRAGLRGKFSSHFLDGLRAKAQFHISSTIDFTIDYGDILEVEADVIALKYAQKLYGADLAVTNALKAVGAETVTPAAGEFALVESKGAISAPYALFVGTPILRFFGYQQIREFAAAALGHIKQLAPQTRHVAMTLHGPGRSLDPAEAVLSQFAGLRDAMLAGSFPPGLERITIAEFNSSRVERLRTVLETALADADYATPFETAWRWIVHHLWLKPNPRRLNQPVRRKPNPMLMSPLPPSLKWKMCFIMGCSRQFTRSDYYVNASKAVFLRAMYWSKLSRVFARPVLSLPT